MITTDIEIAKTDGPRWFKTIHLSRCARQQICVTIVDERSRVLDLGSLEPVLDDKCNTDCDACEVDRENPGFEDGQVPKRDWPDVSIRLRAVSAFGQSPQFDVQGTILDSRRGKVVFHVDQRQTNGVGVFLGEIGLFRGDLLMASYGVYVSLQPSVFDQSYDGDGMITIPEVRLALADERPEDNYLLDALEFRDDQILACIRHPVDLWNSMLPIVREYSYKIQDFPFRYPWLRCAAGHLLEIAANSYMRNDLPVTTGGVSVRDKAKAPEYFNRGKQLITEFKEWAQAVKASMSVNDAFGGVRSTYYSRGYPRTYLRG